jgi:hypothetical protein
MIDPQGAVDLWLDERDEVQDSSWWECTALAQMTRDVATSVRSAFGGSLLKKCDGYSVVVIHRDGGMTIFSGEGVFDYADAGTPLSKPQAVLYLDADRGKRSAWGKATAEMRIAAYRKLLAKIRPTTSRTRGSGRRAKVFSILYGYHRVAKT